MQRQQILLAYCDVVDLRGKWIVSGSQTAQDESSCDGDTRTAFLYMPICFEFSNEDVVARLKRVAVCTTTLVVSASSP